MSKYTTKGGAIAEAKQLTEGEALKLSVWLDYHQVPNTSHLDDPSKLGVGPATAGLGDWVVVIPQQGYHVSSESDFQRMLETGVLIPTEEQ